MINILVLSGIQTWDLKDALVALVTSVERYYTAPKTARPPLSVTPTFIFVKYLPGLQSFDRTACVQLLSFPSQQ